MESTVEATGLRLLRTGHRPTNYNPGMHRRHKPGSRRASHYRAFRPRTGDDKTQNETNAKLWRWIQRNPVVVLSAVIAFIAGSKILRFTGGNPQAMNAVAQSLNLLSLAYAVILPYAPMAIVFAGSLFLARYFVNHDRRAYHMNAVTLTIILALTIVPMLYCPILWAIVIPLGFTVIELLQRRAYTRNKTRSNEVLPTKEQVVTSVALTLIIVAMAIWTPTPWLTTEKVKLSDNSDITAVTLSSDVRWTTLIEPGKEVLRFEKTPDILDRQPCHESDGLIFESVAALNWNRNMPPCPE